MRWPWMSKDAHDQIVAPLRQRLAELDIERKKAEDEIVRLLGGRPFNFPQAEEQAPVQTSGVEPDPSDDEAAWLGYLKQNKPSDFPAALARVMKRGPIKHFSDPEKKATIASAFDQAEQEVKQGMNGHNAPA
jgi:hypothetical protein